MKDGANIAVVIPALNEAASIGKVIADIPDWVDDIVVADNGSDDGTGEAAQENGARVVVEPERGYGAACLAGIAALDDPDIVVFLDADYSDHPEETDRLVDPILEGRADLAIGSRALGNVEPGALTIQQRFGNWLATRLVRLFWKAKYTDLGPFRAIRFESLKALGMRDRNYGWTVEMQIRAARIGLIGIEVPVSYRKRIGKSKISGTVKGVFSAGYKILATIFISWLNSLRRPLDSFARDQLIVFTRWPEPGTTKTRMIPALGAEGAAQLQREMTEFFMRTAKEFSQNSQSRIEVRYAGGDTSRMNGWLGKGLDFRAQADGDLGRRMDDAFRKAFLAGRRRVIIVGTDCPEISTGILTQALSSLDTHDLVLGPCKDGGYYLIGTNQLTPALFKEIAWGTDQVLSKTREIADRLGLKTKLLEVLDDVDRPEDLSIWERAKAGLG